ncbi:MAG: hypothetical protein PHN88_15385 [Ignavibacteria bacterium]|nr:hypothetical protein [Ignavibacteria bacterium]
MNLFGVKNILKVKLAIIAMLLMSGTLFAQKTENLLKPDMDLKLIVLPGDGASAIDDDSSFKSIFDKVTSYNFTDTIDINFCIPKINESSFGNFKNTNQTAGHKNNDYKKEYTISQNNLIPFTPDTKICYTVKTPGIVTLKIFDSEGKEISTIVNEFQSKGDYEVHFSADALEFSDVPSGIYYYTVEVNNFAEMRSKI